MRNFFFPSMESERLFDPSTPYVFLGGTINGSTWREKLIEKLNVNFFNPVVADWTPDDRRAEEQAKAGAKILFYALTPKQLGFFTIAELTHAVFADSRAATVLILEEDDGVMFEEHQRASVAAICELLMQQLGVHILTNIEEAAIFLNKQLATEVPNGD